MAASHNGWRGRRGNAKADGGKNQRACSRTSPTADRGRLVSGSYRVPRVIASGDLGLELGALRGDPAEELARSGAQLMLCSCLEAEVTLTPQVRRSGRHRPWHLDQARPQED